MTGRSSAVATAPGAPASAPAAPALERIWEAEAIAGPSRGGIGERLASRYGGELQIPLRADRPTLVANFVETLDGVVSLDGGKAGGGEVSGHNDADRFLMGLLRALADAVVVGAGVLRNSGGPRTPGESLPAAADDYADLRNRLGLLPNPTLLVVTSSGDVDLDHPAFHDPGAPAVIAGPAAAVARLADRPLPPQVRLATMPSDDVGAELAQLIASFGGWLAVSEAGPNLTGQLVATGALDELFLTVSPQLAGRAPGIDRLSLVEGVGFWPNLPRWLDLQSVRRSGDHLFLRYAFGANGNGR